MEALGGKGCSPRRTTPRTICLIAVSGCALVGLAVCALDLRRVQSVLDVVAIEGDFTFACFAQRDDADFMFGLRMND